MDAVLSAGAVLGILGTQAEKPCDAAVLSSQVSLQLDETAASTSRFYSQPLSAPGAAASFDPPPQAALASALATVAVVQSEATAPCAAAMPCAALRSAPACLFGRRLSGFFGFQAVMWVGRRPCCSTLL